MCDCTAPRVTPGSSQVSVRALAIGSCQVSTISYSKEQNKSKRVLSGERYSANFWESCEGQICLSGSIGSCEQCEGYQIMQHGTHPPLDFNQEWRRKMIVSALIIGQLSKWIDFLIWLPSAEGGVASVYEHVLRTDRPRKRMYWGFRNVLRVQLMKPWSQIRQRLVRT